MPHLDCTNDDTREDPDCVNGHDWPEVGARVYPGVDTEHRIVGSEATIKVPHWAAVTVVGHDKGTHSCDQGVRALSYLKRY